MSIDVTWHASAVTRTDRSRGGPGGATVWLTGLSGSGKSTIAVALERRLVDEGRQAYLLDGDNLRFGLNVDLGFDDADRDENVRRVGAVAALFADAGLIALAPVISPRRAQRDAVRAAHRATDLPFLEVHVATPLTVCEQRDTKGLYAKARRGELPGMTGIDSPYEAPTAADVVLRPEVDELDACVESVRAALFDRLGGAA